MALIITIEGKYSKEDWINNFTIVAAMLEALSGKLDAEAVGANNGLATLNNFGKLVQVALNSERLENKTLEEVMVDVADYVNDSLLTLNISSIDGLATALSQKIETDEKGVANGVATLNSEGKVVEVALNSEKVGSLSPTEVIEFANDYTNSQLDLLNIASIDGLADALGGKQDTIMAATGWSGNRGTEARSGFNSADWSEATGTKTIEDLARYFAAILMI
ncbi:MAG: hypothetical protein ACEQSR_01300 [Candidatus Methylacidiphilales bacterium]